MKNFKLVKTTAALALGASVVTAAVVPGATDASAASKYKVSNGKLVNAKTGKVVKGYVVFKSKLYYNGKLKKGYKTVGSGKTIKLYYNGSLKKGYKTAKNNKLLFFNGSLKKGYKTAGNGERLYKDGQLDKGYEVYGDVDKDPSLYYNGYLKSGYKTANNATLLFYNGKLKEGYKTAKEGTVLYKDGRLNKGLALVEEKLYKDSSLNKGLALFEEKLYKDSSLNKGLALFEDKLYKDSSLNKGLALFEDKLYKDSSLNKGLEKYEEKFYFDGELANGTYEHEGKEIAIEKGIEVGAKVKSVEAINGKQLKVTFNKKVDQTSAQTVGNYTFDDANTVVANGATLQEDGRTVILTLTNAYANTSEHSVAVTVKNIIENGTVDTKLPLFTTVVKINDTAKPEVSGVTATTNGDSATSVKVSFSEPIAAGATFKINGTYVSASYTAGDKEVTLTVSSGLAVGTTHKVEVVNLKDLAGNESAVATKDFTVTKDAVAPTVSKVEAYGDNAVLVTFDKKMKTTSAALTAMENNIKVKDDTLNDVTVTGVTQLDGDSETQFVVQLKTAAGAGSAANLYSSTKTSHNLTVLFVADQLEDYLGNKLAAATKTTTISKDTVAPEITNVTYKKDSNGKVVAIEVNFSEAVAANSTLAFPTNVVNENGVIVTSASVFGTIATANVAKGDTSAKFVVTPGSLVATGSYSVSFPAGYVNDTALVANASKAYSKTLDFGKTTVGTEYTVSSATASSNVITVTFPEAVKGGAGTDSATNVANYTLNGKPLPEGTTITLNNTNQPTSGTVAQTIATITLPSQSVNKTDSKAIFTVNGVKSISGKTNKSYTTTLAVADNVSPVLQSAKVIDNKTIELTYNEDLLSTISNASVADEFIIYQGSTPLVLTGAELKASVVPGYSKKLKLTINKGTDAPATDASVGAVNKTGTGLANLTTTQDFTGNADAAFEVIVKTVDASNKPATVTIKKDGTTVADNVAVTPGTALSDAALEGIQVTITDSASVVGDKFAFAATAAVASTSATTLDLTKALSIETVVPTSNVDVKDAGSVSQKAAVKVDIAK